MRVTAACIQMQSMPDVRDNLAVLDGFMRTAKDKGVQLVVVPENVCCMTASRAGRFARAADEAQHEAIPAFANWARTMGLWIVAGSLSIKTDDAKLANRCLAFDPSGHIVARYDKIHLYDADPKPGERYRESEDFVGGNKAVCADTPWGKVGLTICYDLRFPHLFRALAKAGAKIITVPAAFTQTTGMAHWHTLLRARAIETGCYILAPAQTGTHEGGRQTYGHSLIIAPWGDVLADAGTDVGVITATLDLDAVAAARSAIPSLQHDRAFGF